jgi:hypothetical protein
MTLAPGEYPAISMQEIWALIGEKEVMILQLKKAINERDVFIATLLDQIKKLKGTNG